jgi:hypothetical protein
VSVQAGEDPEDTRTHAAGTWREVRLATCAEGIDTGVNMRACRGFVPHWFMMLMLIGTGIVILAAILIPILLRMLAR